MSFRDDMKEVGKRKIEIVDSRMNAISEDNYKALYNSVFSIIKENISGCIKYKTIHYDLGFFGEKNPRYEASYGIRITVLPDKINEFYSGIGIYNEQYSSLYGRGWIHLQTAYLDDVRKSLLYLLKKAKEDQFDHILIAPHDTEHLHRPDYGCEFTDKEIDDIILELKMDWQRKVDSNFNKGSDAGLTRDIIVQIKCDWKGNII